MFTIKGSRPTVWIILGLFATIFLLQGMAHAGERTTLSAPMAVPTASGTIPPMACETMVTMGVLAPTMPAWCMSLFDAPGTFHSSGNSWVDDFDHGLNMAGIGPGYKVFTETNNHTYQAAHFRHNDHWMVDLKGESLDAQWGASDVGGVTMRPDRSFRFENGKLVIEAVVAAGIADYGLHAWPEIDVTTAPAPTGKVVDNLYGYGLFGGHWTVGIRLQASREPIIAMYDDSERTFFEGGRQFELSFFQHEGAAEVNGGTPYGELANAWRVCQGTDPDKACRDHFRWELTRDTITLYVNGIKYMEHGGLPAGKQLPDELLNGDVYVYFSSWMGQPGADAIRYHWDRVAVNPTDAAPGSTPTPLATPMASPQPTATPIATIVPAEPCDNGLTAEVGTTAASSTLYGAFETIEDANAGGNQAVTVDEAFGERRTPDRAHRVVTCFTVPVEGTYRLQGRTFSPDNGSNSFYLQLDDRPAAPIKWHLPIDDTRYQNADGRLQAHLSAGRHWVTVYLREDGTRLDTLELTPVEEGTKLAGAIALDTFTMTGSARSAIRGRIWLDHNGDGIQANAEPGLGGVLLMLHSAGGLPLTNTMSADDGLYTFGELPPGNYVVYVHPGSLPVNLLPSYDRDDEVDNQTAVALDMAAPWLDVDFGYRPAGDDLGDGVTCRFTDPVSQTACQTQIDTETGFPSWMVVKARSLLPVVNR